MGQYRNVKNSIIICIFYSILANLATLDHQRCERPCPLCFHLFILSFLSNCASFQPVMWRPKLTMILQTGPWYLNSQVNRHKVARRCTEAVTEAVLRGSRIFVTGPRLQCTKAIISVKIYHFSSIFKIFFACHTLRQPLHSLLMRLKTA